MLIWSLIASSRFCLKRGERANEYWKSLGTGWIRIASWSASPWTSSSIPEAQSLIFRLRNPCDLSRSFCSKLTLLPSLKIKFRLLKSNLFSCVDVLNACKGIICYFMPLEGLGFTDVARWYWQPVTTRLEIQNILRQTTFRQIICIFRVFGDNLGFSHFGFFWIDF